MRGNSGAVVLACLLVAGCGKAPAPSPAPTDVFVSVLRCGDEEVELQFQPDGAVLTAAGVRYPLAQVRSGSGARYEAAGDSTTWAWNKGQETRVSVRGRDLGVCRPVER